MLVEGGKCRLIGIAVESISKTSEFYGLWFEKEEIDIELMDFILMKG